MQHHCVRDYLCLVCCFFFFNDTATTEIYTLSVHDALPISPERRRDRRRRRRDQHPGRPGHRSEEHTSELQSPYVISYAVFCLKNKTTQLRHSSKNYEGQDTWSMTHGTRH